MVLLIFDRSAHRLLVFQVDLGAHRLGPVPALAHIRRSCSIGVNGADVALPAWLVALLVIVTACPRVIALLVRQ